MKFLKEENALLRTNDIGRELKMLKMEILVEFIVTDNKARTNKYASIMRRRKTIRT